MEETDTTVEQPTTTGEQSQPETTAEATAEATTEDTQPTQGADGSTAEAEDNNLSWLKSKGIDPADPQAMSKVAEMYRNAEKQMHARNQEAKSQLQDAAHGAAGGDDLQEIKNQLTVLQFYTSHPEAKELDEQMATIVEKKPWLANDLEDVLTLARAQKHADELRAAESKGREAAKTEIARAGAAQAPRGNASARSEASPESERLKRFSSWD